ncbi:MAG: eukaryotic-like serine/threonine-protein kinase [Myxococcales bacterium]|nr:eukaryotic-like serine/threonine-protein kinase [Myxococcales bacterium]
MTRVIDHWVVDAELGSGGMASIYRAHHERLGRPVALKILKRSLLDDDVARERFHREAVVLATLSHPNIVKVLDSGESEGDVYMVLELLAGTTLERIILEKGALGVDRAIPILDDLLSALEVCHASHIVHRDIKPSNVMIAREEDGRTRLVVIDFGLARVRGNIASILTETGVVQGTAHYMSPEQCRGEDVGPESDVYSAGLVLYELLSGARPFPGSDAATLMAQHLFVEPTKLRQVAADVSAGVEAAVHAALAKQPQDRPTAGQLRAALAAAAAGTDPQSLAEQAAAQRRRAGALSRNARATPEGPSASASASARAQPTPVASGTVAVWIRDTERGAAIRGCVATAGLSCAIASGDDAPHVAGNATTVVVVSARDGIERVSRLQSVAPNVPVVVVDIQSPDETAAAIRAGASDMLLRGAPDADLVAKLTRLFRRQSRS